MDHPDTTIPRRHLTEVEIPTPALAADLDGSLGRDDDPARRLARQSRAPAVQSPLRTRILARTTQRRPRRAPACAGSHHLVAVSATARRQQRDAQAQAQKGEGTATATATAIATRSPPPDCQRSQCPRWAAAAHHASARRDAPCRDRHIARCPTAEQHCWVDARGGTAVRGWRGVVR